MGLRSRLRKLLVVHGYRVPGLLIPPDERMLHAALREIGPGMVVIDVGAHRGETAAVFAARGATVYAFEPNPDIYPELQAAARRYPGIVPANCGVLDAEGEMPLHLHREYRENPVRRSESSSFLAEKPGLSDTDTRLARVRDVAEVVREIGRPIALVKIDAEGAEYRILRRLIESGVIESVRRVRVETHHDRIPSLRGAHDDIVALIAARGLGDRIRLDWV